MKFLFTFTAEKMVLLMYDRLLYKLLGNETILLIRFYHSSECDTLLDNLTYIFLRTSCKTFVFVLYGD